MKPRREARHVALQVLYELDCTNHSVDEAFVLRVADNPMEPDNIAFARQVVDGVRLRTPAIDALILKHAPDYPLDTLSVIDVNIMRIAIWENAVARYTPARVAIFEAVEMAKIYGGEASPRFINGVLGTIFTDPSELVRELAVQ